MSPLAKLRVELTNLIYRVQTGKLRDDRDVKMAVQHLQIANDILGAALVRQLEAVKAKEGGRV